MMKILVIFTGGTIGSMAKDGYLSPENETTRQLLSLYENTFDSNVEFVVDEPYFILSENLSAKELNLLVECVVKASKKDYDGIIITHGTDTLQYSAAALSFALGTKSIPVLLVSSSFPLEHPRANGLANFSAAVEFIRQKKGRGVFVSYQNENQGHFFHLGDRLLSHLESDDAIFSVNFQHYASFSDGEINILGKGEKREALSSFSLCENPEILVVDAVPAMSYDFRLENKKAVILRPFHSGTLDTANEKFKNFCYQAKEKNIPVFLVNARKSMTYFSTKEFSLLHIIPLYSAPFISVYMRLWIAISLGENVSDVMIKYSDAQGERNDEFF